VTLDEWSIDKSKLVYGLNRNDLHFLDIDEEGLLMLRIGKETISIEDIIRRIEAEDGERVGYASSFTLRLPQLISYQVMKLRRVFETVTNRLGYTGKFMAVYPVKVNQRRDYVVQVLRTDPEYGLEAGTKAELFLIKSVLEKEKHRLIVCNGAKDPEYLDSIADCIKVGYNIAISVESLHEARLIVERFEPKTTNLVLRLKPYLTVRGHWSHSTGRDSKFGLSIHDLFDAVELLKEKDFHSSVSTILGHVGSQITAIEDFHVFAVFVTRVFQELREMGLSNLMTIDFGGGLPIDYTGTHQPNLMELYAQSLVTGVKDELRNWPNGIVPNIIVESGRGLTALGSMVMVKALEVRSVFPPTAETKKGMKKTQDETMDMIASASSVSELLEIWNKFNIKKSGLAESLSDLRARETDIANVRAEIRRQLAKLGSADLKPDTHVESLWHPDHIVIGNFSVFNSACDYVLVQQHFPITPIRDLHVRPETTVRLVDITCDSDGEISQFHRKKTEEIWFTQDFRPLTMTVAGTSQGIPVGYLKNIQGSYFAIALTGAYQDVIEMNHNLLGDLPDVEVLLTKEKEWQVSWLTGAESMEDLLEEMGYVGFDIDEDPYMSGDN
jgi:arginine decarboxylase